MSVRVNLARAHGTTRMYFTGCRCSLCRAAKSADAKAYREEFPEKCRESKRRYYEKNKITILKKTLQYQRDNPEKRRRYSSEWRKRNRSILTAVQREYRKENRKRTLAHWTVGNAVRSGRLVRQPCEVCGNPRSNAHHEDYNAPLEVKWLCHRHHDELHRRTLAGGF